MFAHFHSGASESETTEVRVGLADAVDPSAFTEFRGLVDGCGVYTLDSRGTVFVSGEDRTRWLNEW